MPHLKAVLKRAAEHKGSAFVEVMQNCNIYNDKAFAALTDKTGRQQNGLYLEHGKPLVFGDNKDKGLRFTGTDFEVIELGNGKSEDDCLVWDEEHANPSLAFQMASISTGDGLGDFPVPLGVLRAIDAPTYDAGVIDQIDELTTARAADPRPVDPRHGHLDRRRRRQRPSRRKLIAATTVKSRRTLQSWVRGSSDPPPPKARDHGSSDPWRTRAGRQAGSALLFAALVWAAAPAPGQEVEIPEVFSETIDVRVVNVEVVVTDRQGNRVQGLKPSDFELLVDGQPTPIAYFTEIEDGFAAGGETADISGIPALDLNAPVGTNFLIFIDDLFSIKRDRNRVLDRLRDDLRTLASRGPGGQSSRSTARAPRR